MDRKKSPNGDQERVFSVEGNAEYWVLKVGRNSFILDDNLEELRETNLSVGNFIQVGFRETGVQAHILVTDLQAADLIFRKLVARPNTEFTIGSDPECDIIIDHPLIAACHCMLQFKDNAFRIEDRNSKYGIYLNQQCIVKADLQPGDVLYLMGISIIIGDNFISVNHLSRIRTANSKAFSDFTLQVAYSEVEEGFFDDERVESVFFRSPRFKRDINTYELRIDTPPSKIKPNDTPAILTLGPAMTMGMSSVVTATFSISTNLSNGGSLGANIPTLVMSGTMLLGCLLWPTLSRKHENKQNRKNEKIRQKKYYAYLEKIKNDIKKQEEIQTEILKENHVALPSCIQRIERQERNLWERMPEHNDFLVVRIGIGNLPLQMNFQQPGENFTVEEDELTDAMLLLVREPKMVKDVPVPHSLMQSYITGITGIKDETEIFIRNMLLQLAATHSYTDLKVVFLYEETEEEKWAWVRWLPHVWNKDETIWFVASNNDELKVVTAYFEQMIASLTESGKQSSLPTERYVIISTNRTLGKKAEMINQLLDIPQYIGLSVILEYNELRHLPKECKTVIHVEGENSKVFDRDDISGWNQPFYPEYHQEVSAHDVAVMLANIKLDQTDKAFALPTMLTFLEMCQTDRIEHLNPLERWKANNPVNSLQAPIGVTTKGDYFYLDLHEKYHGPHGLIAGMTGSGKSEFIMTYILSLALNYHPYEVAFILIDYKGGGMANAFTNLPHLAGTITNLDGAAITRSLISIESELKRRQAVFGKASQQVDMILSPTPWNFGNHRNTPDSA